MNKISTQNIYLRPITLDDTELIVKWRNTQYVQENFIFRNTLTPQMHKKWMSTKVAKGEVVQYIICEPDNNPIGSVYYRDIDRLEKSAEFGIFIGESSALGKGYGKEAISLFVQYGFNSMGLRKIFLRVLDSNKRAKHLYEKVGFKTSYEEKETIYPSGEEVNVIFMEINEKSLL